ncbi:MAG: DUF2490 domain-containing protein [Lutimonas sp.]
MKRLFIIMLFAPLLLLGQESDIGNWLIYIGDKKINDRFNWHHEVQYRSFNFIGDTEQLLLRTGLGYNLSENNNNILLGYGFIYSEPYVKNTDVKTNNTENRIYQQFITKQAFGRLSLLHRYRFEQRFLENDFKLRLRYFLALNMALNHTELSDKTFYLSAYNEIFVNTEQNYFDRNRLYGGMGYKFSKNIKIEIGVMNQTTATDSRNQLNILTFVNF